MQQPIWQVIKLKKERLALSIYSVVLYTGAVGPTRGGELVRVLVSLTGRKLCTSIERDSDLVE